jgi:hypothetical protein
MVEEKTDAAGLAKRTGLEEVPDFRCGTIAIVGQAFDDHRHLVWRETFIDDGLVVDDFVREARALLDGALNGVAIDGRLLRLLHGSGETGVQLGVCSAQLGGDGDFAHQLDDHLTLLLRVGFAPGLFPLCAHEGKIVNGRNQCEQALSP